MYASINEVQHPTYLRAWEDNHQGGKGTFLKSEFIEPRIYGSPPDDALGKFHWAKENVHDLWCSRIIQLPLENDNSLSSFVANRLNKASH
jgi:hypothetical protein